MGSLKWGLTSLLYQLLINALGPLAAALATLKGRFGGRWRERLGLTLYRAPVYAHPRLWFHAASVGEARVAAGVIFPLLKQCPEADIFLSLYTPAGLAEAEKIFGREPRVTLTAAPLDFWGAPGRALDRIRPRVLVILETELWPNLIFQARKRGVKLMLGAARLTGRSFGRYLQVKSFMTKVLNSFDLIAPADEIGRRFYAGLGAAEERLVIMGTPKYDSLLGLTERAEYQRSLADWRQKLWGPGPAKPLLVVGSTHEGEDELVLTAWGEIRGSAGLKLILAPRHLNRAREILEQVLHQGWSAALASDAPAPQLAELDALVLDTMGDLQTVYGLADVALVGGSLCPGLLGHNPMEPAAVRTLTIFGPHMSSFTREAGELLEGHGAVQTAPETLARDLERWLNDPAAAAEVIEAAWNILHRHQAAGPRLAAAALDLLKNAEK